MNCAGSLTSGTKSNTESQFFSYVRLLRLADQSLICDNQAFRKIYGYAFQYQFWPT
jgi:hypothetical protein